jgi:hypothetical protein
MEQLQYNEEIAKTIQEFLDSGVGFGVQDWDYVFDKEKGKFVFFSMANILPILFMQITVGQNDATYTGLYGIHATVSDEGMMKKLRKYVEHVNANNEMDSAENIENHFELSESSGIVRLVVHADYSKYLPKYDDIGAAISILIFRLTTSANAIKQIIVNDIEEDQAELMQVLDISKILAQFGEEIDIDTEYYDEDDDYEENEGNENGSGSFYA